ncbi:MAG: glycosyl transferase [SAR86 cluster bacterium]|uniref:Glycosyl transferase n=1 Tax=SAR86 cluster bacterium TaxID=2030880 RepID=A0A2A5AZC1_9GAMM|nr:MAG: glycosyl transferase [SAR86 cluster bacterium]
MKISIVIPAKNEAENLKGFLPRLVAAMPDAECIVVNDGSTDDTISVCEQHGVKIVNHPYSKGNGAAIKSGARIASGDTIVFLDGDGQHKPEDIPRLLDKLEQGFDMIVGARDKASQADSFRALANRLYNWLSSAITGHKILDLTSGFRVVKADKFREFLYLLPNGFSYPTTSTMAFFRAGYSVGYEPIQTEQRLGKSHISLLKDGVRFLLIIFKVGTLYSPLKIFLPFATGFFVTGLLNYMYTYFSAGRFTNMSAVLFMTSIIVFLIGLVSEQVTALMYKDSGKT